MTAPGCSGVPGCSEVPGGSAELLEGFGVRKEAWPGYRTISGVRLCWELEEPKGPKECRGQVIDLQVLKSCESGVRAGGSGVEGRVQGVECRMCRARCGVWGVGCGVWCAVCGV